MNTEQLKCFLSVANHLNFTKAAKEFYVSQPAISHQISEFENELGIKLFHRSTRSVSLTRAGELFVEDAKKFLDYEIITKDKLKTLEKGKNLSLNIGYLSAACKPFLPDIINEFQKTYPEVEINLIRHDAQGLKTSLETRQYDIYFSTMEDLIINKNYQCRKLFADYYSFALRKDHLLLLKNKINFDILNEQTLIIHNAEKSPFLTKQVFSVCKDIGFSPKRTLTFNRMEEIIFAAESGLGITILPDKFKDYLQTQLVFIPIEVETISTIGIAWTENKGNPATPWFMEFFNN